MGWLMLHVDCAAEHVESAAELLHRCGAESVSVAPLSPEPLFGGVAEATKYWQGNRVAALFTPDVDLDIVLAALRNRIGTEHILAHGVEAAGEIDWAGKLRESAGARIHGGRLCVCPSWAEPLPAEHVLVLDPGLAFGSGTHATTRLCLDWLVRTDLRNARVIDYGCGSGVLGLAACLLGAASVHAVDIDPQALAATRANAERNGLADRLQVQSPESAPLPAADVLVANILLGTLIEHAEAFAVLVKRGGRIALSGLLEVQVDDCLGAFRPWFNMDGPEYDGEWALLHGRRAP